MLRRPQTLGKIERFWGTLWRECIETAVFVDLGDAQRRIGHFAVGTSIGQRGLVNLIDRFGQLPAGLGAVIPAGVAAGPWADPWRRGQLDVCRRGAARRAE